ncbi:MAG: kynureninase [Paracoccus sp. (in: a-proteobacteria)]|uniref:kynureninase n=1 Tax=Paracoccus sp. TaxID=267 RepID=UPI0039E2461D
MTAIDDAAIAAMDAADPLAPLRAGFLIPQGEIYLDGNSLGPASLRALEALQLAASHEWQHGLIRSWNSAGWFDLPIELGDRIGALIGAAPGQTVVGDTTSVNIYKALHAAMGLRPGRATILAEAGSFPTDLYIAEGVASTLPGAVLRLEGRDGARIEEMLDDSVAVLLVNQVNYKTGALRDMAALTRLAHRAGALVVWDLCHSAGALPVELDACQADMAVGCSYKYLNGGPGAPAYIYVARRHHAQARQPLSGWWGHARPFAFETGYQGDPGIRRFQCGTQPILSMQALRGALQLWDGVDMALLRAKSMAMTDLFIALVEQGCAGLGLSLQSPREAAARGSQVSFTHENAYAVMQALIARGVIGDFRAPSTLRFGFAPLYLSFAEVARAAGMLHEVLASGEWREPRFAVRAAVT